MENEEHWREGIIEDGIEGLESFWVSMDGVMVARSFRCGSIISLGHMPSRGSGGYEKLKLRSIEHAFFFSYSKLTSSILQ
jgi:hypothetical protein